MIGGGGGGSLGWKTSRESRGGSRVGGLMIEGGLVLISTGNVKPLLVAVTVVAVLVSVNVLVMVDEIPLRLGFLIWFMIVV